MGSCKSISESAKEDLIVIATFERLLRNSEDDVPSSITGIVSQLIDELKRIVRCEEIKFVYFQKGQSVERREGKNCCRLMIEVQNKIRLGEIEYPNDVSLQNATLIKAISLFTTQLIERIHLSQLSSSLIAMMEIQREYKSVPFVMQSICKIVEDALDIDFVSLFCCDDECIVPLHPQNMMCVDSLDVGILGHVATTKKSVVYSNEEEKKKLNLSKSIEENVRMCVDGEIESLLCIPISVSDSSDNVLLAINSKKKNFVFTNLKISLVETLSIEIAKFLEKRTTQLLLTDANNDDATKSMLKHFRASHFRSTLLSKQLPIEQRVSDEMSTSELSMRNSLKIAPSPKAIIALKDIIDLTFDPFGLSVDEMVTLALRIFNELGLIKDLSIPLAKIRHFIEQILLSYNDNPYHNKYHGFSVFGFLYSMIKRTKLNDQKKLSQMDILSLLIAAISHDADHPGNSNNFEISTMSHLAHVHNDVSVLENHHCNVTFDILRDYNFTLHFKKSEKRTFRKRIVKSILATDMTHHFELCGKLNTYDQTQFSLNLSSAEKNEKFIQIVCNTFVHTADVMTSACPLPLSIKWAKKVCAEFTNQVKREKILGIESMQMMKDLDSDEQFFKSQLNFIKFILHPLFKQVVRLFPALQNSYSQMIENEKYFQAELDKVDGDKLMSL